MEALNRYRHLVSDYYILNLAVIASYAYVRHIWRETEVDLSWRTTSYILQFEAFEMQVFSVSVASTAWAIIKGRTFDAKLLGCLRTMQLFVLIATLAASIAVSSQYLLAFLVIILLFYVPTYSGPNNVTELNPTTMQTGPMGSDGSTWVVLIYTDYSQTCRTLFSTFAALSNQYSTDKLKFGRFNIGEWPSLAKKYTMDLSSSTQQLPTWVLYEKGAEMSRLPRVYGEDVVGENFTRKDAVRLFELDMRYTRSVGSSAPQPLNTIYE